MDYSLSELMIAAAAREIHDPEIVFVGMRLPLLAFLVAKATHAPHAIGLYENGIIRQKPAPELLYTMGDPPNVLGATFCGQMIDVMGFLQQGKVDVGFIGAGEVDRFGNLNSSYVRDGNRLTRLPGSGGACDIASLAKRVVVILPHEKRRLKEQVDYVTSPGYGTGNGWRRKVGLPHGGTSVVITTKGILRFEEQSGEAHLSSYHPGVTIEEIKKETGWALKVNQNLHATEPPDETELKIIRNYDPHRFWTK